MRYFDLRYLGLLAAIVFWFLLNWGRLGGAIFQLSSTYLVYLLFAYLVGWGVDLAKSSSLVTPDPKDGLARKRRAALFSAAIAIAVCVLALVFEVPAR